MSHVVDINVQIRDLAALRKAAEACGLEFRKGQKTYRWYGHFVGDSPMPEGFKVEDLGKCSHALSVKGNPRAYEIGVVRRKDGQPGYTLMFDFFGRNGGALEEKAGKRCGLLRQRYTAEVVKATMGKYWKVEETETPQGSLLLNLTGGPA